MWNDYREKIIRELSKQAEYTYTLHCNTWISTVINLALLDGIFLWAVEQALKTLQQAYFAIWIYGETCV